MDVNAVIQSGTATLIAVAWKAVYWQVYFDTNRLIRETFGEAGFPAPMPSYAVTGGWSAPPADALAR